MKRFSLILMIFTITWLTGCEREKPKTIDNPIIVIDGKLDDGSIIIDNHPEVDINNSLNEMLDASSTTISGSRMRMGVKASDDNTDLKANDYLFKLVAEMSTLKLSDGYEVQATDVKIDGDYAFVSYNDEGPAHRGGVVVYRYTITPGTLETVKVDVEIVAGMQLPKAELSALEYYNGKLYMIGASSEPSFGYNENEDGWNYAFLLVMELNANKTFNMNATPKIIKLTSFQGTSICVSNDKIYVTTGDGTNGTKGGLYILKTTDYSLVNFIEGKDHARSVVVDDANVYLMQAEPARITKYDLKGDDETPVYPPVYNLNSNEPGNEFSYVYENEALQQEAKSEILSWGSYLFVAMNESGLRMLTKDDGNVNQALERPGEDKDKHVTNSACMNTDKKKDINGKEVQSNLLLLANGEKGVYWFDVVKDTYGNDRIVANEANSILGKPGLSTNFISSRGNIVFVANGLGGLKVLYLGFPEEEPGDICPDAFHHETFLKANGNAKDDPPLSKKVGDVLIQTEGDDLVVYLWATVPNYKLNRSGVIFGPSLEYFDNLNGLFTGSGSPKDKNINNGFMSDRNSQYRTIYSDGSVRFVFPKSEIEKLMGDNGELLCIVYSGNNAWGYGNPNGPSGVTGTGVNNNGQIIVLKVTFCE